MAERDAASSQVMIGRSSRGAVVDLELLVPTLFAAYMAYNYGSAFGYAFWHVHDPIGAVFYGGGSVFIASMLAGRAFLVRPARNALNSFGTSVATAKLNWRRRKDIRPAATVNLQQAIERGWRMEYVGLVDRDFHYTDQRPRRQRVRAPFSLVRNTMAMTPRDRQATEILEELDRHGLLGNAADALRFALTWGDGSCMVYGDDVKNLNPQMAMQNNLHSLKAIVARDAEARGMNVEGAITELYGLLQDAAAAETAPEPVKALLRRFQRDPARPHAAAIVLR